MGLLGATTFPYERAGGFLFSSLSIPSLPRQRSVRGVAWNNRDSGYNF